VIVELLVYRGSTKRGPDNYEVFCSSGAT